MGRVSESLSVLFLCTAPHLVVELVEDCKNVGEGSLKFLGILKLEKPGSGNIASRASSLQASIRALQRKADVRRKREGGGEGMKEGMVYMNLR